MGGVPKLMHIPCLTRALCAVIVLPVGPGPICGHAVPILGTKSNLWALPPMNRRHGSPAQVWAPKSQLR
jgi:hypothetical protein